MIRGDIRTMTYNLLSGTDVKINISAEDLGLFISKNDTAVSHVKSAICILDIDSFDVAINLRENPPSSILGNVRFVYF